MRTFTPVNEPSPARSYNGKSAASRKYAKICYQFVARNANELSVLQDEVLEVRPPPGAGPGEAAAAGWRDVRRVFPQVIEDGKQWWKLRNRSGQTGYVPFNVLEVVNADEQEGVFGQVSC